MNLRYFFFLAFALIILYSAVKLSANWPF